MPRFVRGRPPAHLVLALVGSLLAGLTACGDAASPTDVVAAGRDDPLTADLSEYDEGVAESIADARAALASRPEDPERHGLLGMVFEANFVPHLALPCYEAAARLAPEDARWWFHAARAHEALGDTAQATEAMTAAAARATAFAPAHWRLGFLHMRDGDLPAAQAAFHRALEISGAELPALAGLARVHLQGDEIEAALQVLERAQAVRPDDRYVHSLLGTVLGRLERWDEAEREMALGEGATAEWGDPWQAEMLSHRVDTIGLAVLRTGTLIEGGEAAEAIRILEELRPRAPDDFTLLTQLTLAYVRGERFQRAMQTAQRCLELQPGDLTALLNLAGVQAQLGRLGLAKQTLEAAAELYPDEYRVHKALGAVLHRSGDPAGCARALRRAWECDERHTTLLFDVGMIELRLRRWDAAQENFRLALDRGLDTPDLQIGLAKTLLETGDLDGAAAALEAVGGRAPKDPRPLNQVRRELAERRAAGGR